MPEFHDRRDGSHKNLPEDGPFFFQPEEDDYVPAARPWAPLKEDEHGDDEYAPHQECAVCGRDNDDYEHFRGVRLEDGTTSEPMCAGCRGAHARGEL